MFGQPAATPFGSPPAAATPFGAPAPAPGVFGAPSAFGSPAPSARRRRLRRLRLAPPARRPGRWWLRWLRGGAGASAGSRGLRRIWLAARRCPLPRPLARQPRRPSTPFGAPRPSARRRPVRGRPGPSPPPEVYSEAGRPLGRLGAPAPAAGGFGTGGFGAPATGGFGAPAAAAPSAFGAPAPAPATGLFGATGPRSLWKSSSVCRGLRCPSPGARPVRGDSGSGGRRGYVRCSLRWGSWCSPGTKAVPYQVTTRTDGATSINLQTLTAMPAYESKSTEELRLEDYMAGNKGTMGQAPCRQPRRIRRPCSWGLRSPRSCGLWRSCSCPWRTVRVGPSPRRLPPDSVASAQPRPGADHGLWWIRRASTSSCRRWIRWVRLYSCSPTCWRGALWICPGSSPSGWTIW